MRRAVRSAVPVLLGLAWLVAWLVLRASPSSAGRSRGESLAAEPASPAGEVRAGVEGGRTLPAALADVAGVASPAATQPARTLDGRILVGEVPIQAGVEVGAQIPAAGEWVVLTTDGGAFRFADLPARPLRLSLPQRYRLRDVSWPATIEWAGAWALVPADVDSIEIRCSLEPGLRGRILDQAGAAVPAAVLVPDIRWIGGGSRGGEFASQADGRFEIPRVDPREVSAGTLRISHPSAGFLDLALRGNELPADGEFGDLVLARGLTLVYRACDAGGQPLAGAVGSTGRASSPPTAADGRAALMLAPTDAELRVDCDGYLPAFLPLAGYRGEEVLVRLVAAARLEVEFLLPEDLQPLAVRLRLAVPEGQALFESEERPGQEGRRFTPARWCRTWAAGGHVWRLESGLRRDRRVTVNGLAIGAPISLSLHQAGVLQERSLAPFAAGERRRLAIDLSDSGRRLWGRVVNETGLPVAGAMVSVGDDSGSSSCHADGRGEFRVGPFAASRLHVRVMADGYQEGEFEILADVAERCHEFVLARARAVRLELRDPGGHLIEVPSVRLLGEWEPAEPPGTFTLLGLPMEAAPIALEIQGVRFAGTVPAGADRYVLTLEGVGVAEIRTHGLQEIAASPGLLLLRVVRLDPPAPPLLLRATPRARHAVLAGSYRVEVVELDRRLREPDRFRVVGGPVGLHVVAGATAVIELEAEP